ncbi:MAG: FRG domain-containing protein, partial [Methanophagales archaeon]|nr:FRG domain-containing protein [Methanophagales archaeon]
MKGNWLLGNLHDSELRELISKGLAFQASPFVIPVLHVYSIKDYLSLIETYIGTENNLVQRPFYLRGQNEDHFLNGRLQILPPAYRRLEWWSLYNRIDTNLAKELRGLLDPWEDCLRKEFGRSFGLAYVKILYFPEDPPNAQRVVTSNLPSVLVVNNILAMAVLQHYGFPTPCLDVTRSPAIALWFALHKAHTVDEGVTYRALESVEHSAVNNIDSLRHLPSVYIFYEFVPEPPTIDYGEFKWLKKISIRPYLQSAASL